MVEWARLENESGLDKAIEGSNPSLSAAMQSLQNKKRQPLGLPFFVSEYVARLRSAYHPQHSQQHDSADEGS